MKFSICNETYQGWGWSDTCEHISRTGYDGVEVAPFTLARDIRNLGAAERREICRTAADYGLEVVGLHWLLVSPKGMSITSADPGPRLQTSDYLTALVDFCSDLSAKIMVLGSPAQRRIPEAESWETAAEMLHAALLPALDRAREAGITICLEPLPQPEANFVLTLSEARSIIDRFGHPALKTILDIKSACSESTPVPELIAEYAPLIAHVHANDANRRGPGFGDVDFRPIFHALAAADYHRWVSVEVFDYLPDAETIAAESLRYLKVCSGL